jgi:putative GTP pyrophosphokinase
MVNLCCHRPEENGEPASRAEIDRRVLLLEESDRQRGLIEEFCEYVGNLISALIGQSDIRVSSIDRRVKTRTSLESKLGRKGYTHLSEITDFAGVRVVTYFADDVDRVARLIREAFEVDVRNSVDKRRTLQIDQFGYQSVHYVVNLTPARLQLPELAKFRPLRVEIQIRSLLQHTWAEIEHRLEYKATGKDLIPARVKRSFARLAGLLELADQQLVAVRNEATNVTSVLSVCRAESLSDGIADFTFEVPADRLPSGEVTC